MVDAVKHTLPSAKTPKSSAEPSGLASSDRSYACPYAGCERAYIHEYKLNLHLRREHPGHFPDENAKKNPPKNENEMDEGSDRDVYVGKRGNGKFQKQSRPKTNLKPTPSNVPQRKSSGASPANLNIMKKSWPVKEDVYDDEDSEETEERDNVGENNEEDDDEETEYED